MKKCDSRESCKHQIIISNSVHPRCKYQGDFCKFRITNNADFEEFVRFLYSIRYESDKLLCIIEGKMRRIKISEMERKGEKVQFK